MRARTVPRAVLMYFAWQVIWALIAASPLHAAAQRAWGSRPEGDAILFAPGGRALMSWLLRDDAGVVAATRDAMLFVVVGAVLAQLPFGALVAAIATRPARTRDAYRAAVSAFVPLLAILALVSMVQGVVLAIGMGIGGAVDRSLTTRLGDARAFQLGAGAFALFVVIAALAGVVADLARAAAVSEVALPESGTDDPARGAWRTLGRALMSALRAMRAAPLRAFGGWAWRAALGAALVAAGAGVASSLGGKPGGVLLALAAVHQLIILGRTALRASWMAQALRLVAAVR